MRHEMCQTKHLLPQSAHGDPRTTVQALRFGAESSPTSKRWNFFKRVARFQENSFRITL